MRRTIGKWIQIGLFAALPATALAQAGDTRTDQQKQEVAPGSAPMNTPSGIGATPSGDTTKPSDTNPTNDTGKDFNKLDESNKPSGANSGDVNQPSEINSGDVNKPSDSAGMKDDTKVEEHSTTETTTHKKSTKHKKTPESDSKK